MWLIAQDAVASKHSPKRTSDIPICAFRNMPDLFLGSSTRSLPICRIFLPKYFIWFILWPFGGCTTTRILHSVAKPLMYGWIFRLPMHLIEFLVFKWHSHIPKLKTTFPSEVLIASDKRSFRNTTFGNDLARQGSSFCNRARLNFQAFPLRDMKWRPEMAVA